MIETTEELCQAIEQMGRMRRILESYRTDILPKNPRNFAIFAEGPLDEIRKLQEEINAYLGLYAHPFDDTCVVPEAAPTLREAPPP